MQKPRKYLILVMAIVVNLVLAELVLYLFFPQPVYAIKFSPWGWEHIPNISFKYTSESKETVSHIRYNSEGFRGHDEYSLLAKRSTLRIAILGDSEAEGNNVDYANFFAHRLENSLGEHYQKDPSAGYQTVEVIKAGVYSYEPCQFLRLFESRVNKYKPRLVVVIHNGKFSDDVFCQLVDGQLVFNDMEYTQTEYVVRYLLSYIKAKSQLLNYLYRLYKYHLGGGIHLPEMLNKQMFTYAPPDPKTYHVDERDLPLSFAAYLNSLRIADLQQEEVAGENLMMVIYKRFKDLVGAYGGQFVVVVAAEDWKNGSLARGLTKENISFLDLGSYLADTSERAYVMGKGSHWNEYGHYLVSRALFNFVLAMDPQ